MVLIKQVVLFAYSSPGSPECIAAWPQVHLADNWTSPSLNTSSFMCAAPSRQPKLWHGICTPSAALHLGPGTALCHCSRSPVGAEPKVLAHPADHNSQQTLETSHHADGRALRSDRLRVGKSLPVERRSAPVGAANAAVLSQRRTGGPSVRLSGQSPPQRVSVLLPDGGGFGVQGWGQAGAVEGAEGQSRRAGDLCGVVGRAGERLGWASWCCSGSWGQEASCLDAW